MFILGWTPRGLATALLVPRPDSSMLWRGSASSSLATCTGRRSGRHHHWSGGRLRHQYSFVLGGAIHQTHLHKMLCLGIGRAQVAAILVQAKSGTGGPRSWSDGYNLAVSTLVDSSWRGGDGGKVNCRSFGRRELSLSSISSLAVTYSGGNWAFDPAGDSSNGGRQLRQGGGGCALPSAVGPPLG